MKYQQYLIFEITRDCNLGKLHPQCPNLHAERYGSLNVDEPVPDRKIVEVAVAMYREHGFRGRIGFHFYNEPTMASGRMWTLMDKIAAKVSEAGFVLWSNGTLLPDDCSEFARFEEIHITDYQLKKHPVRNLDALKRAQPMTQVHRWPLDNRLHGIGEEVSFAPCHRMFTEFVVDYYGNVHLCCFDWQGQASLGNVQETPLGVLVAEWQKVREQIGGTTMDPRSPLACLKCEKRSAGITGFVPEVARDAREAVRRW